MPTFKGLAGVPLKRGVRRRTRIGRGGWCALVPVLCSAMMFSCVSTPKRTSPHDYQAALTAALEVVEATWDLNGDRHPPVVLVLTTSLPRGVRRAATAVRQTIEIHDLPAPTEYLLPPGCFRVDALEVSGSDATVEGLRGPVPAPEGRGDECGVRYVIRLRRAANGSWVVSGATVRVC